jgi:TonB-dependent receptor
MGNGMKYIQQNSVLKKSLISSAISTALIFGSSLTATAAEQDSKTAGKEIEVIAVTGNINQSYLGAIGAKRLANTIVDVITSEDIGQFSDDSIAGALQRIAGIQIEVDQAGTDGDRVSIRGLGPEFVNSTINGRTLLSPGNEAKDLRKMNFNVFPSSILSGVQVSKGQTAVAPESGLAGQVDLQTIRPLALEQLEKKNYFGLVSYKAEHRDLADDDGGMLEGSFAWKNEQGTFGFYAGAVAGESDMTTEQFSQTRYLKNLRVDNDGDGVQDELIEGVNAPNASTARLNQQTLKRLAFSAGLQWRPNEEIDIVWDITSTTFDHESQRSNGQLIMNPVWGATVFDANGIEIDENNTLQYADFSQTTGGGKILSRMHDQRFTNDTENFITGLNINWTQESLTTNIDVYYSSVDYSQDLRFPIFNKGIDKTQVIYDGRGAVPTFTTGDDRTTPDGLIYLAIFVKLPLMVKMLVRRLNLTMH